MFSLVVTFASGRTLALDEVYPAQFMADRAAGNYIRDFSDPCGTGERVSYVSVIDRNLLDRGQ